MDYKKINNIKNVIHYIGSDRYIVIFNNERVLTVMGVKEVLLEHNLG